MAGRRNLRGPLDLDGRNQAQWTPAPVTVPALDADKLDGQHGSYYAPGGSAHVAVTVSDTASVDLGLTGQALTATVLPAGVDHGGLAGLPDDDHTQYLLANGSRDLAGDLDFAGYKAIALACDNGAAFPAPPSTGQWFYRTDVDTLFLYEAIWRPIIAFSAFSIYVNGALGSDAVGQGYSSGAGATATITYALANLVPRLANVHVTGYIAAGTYVENLALPTMYGGGSLVLVGEYSEVVTGTLTSTYVTGSASAGGTTQTGTISTVGSSTTVTVGGGGNTTNCYPGQIIYATTNLALAGIIVSVDSSSQVTMDRAVDFSAGYTWGVSGGTYIDSGAAWADNAYDGYWLIHTRTGAATTDSARAWPIIATNAAKKSLTVGAHPYNYTATAAYAIAQHTTIIVGTVTGNFVTVALLHWLRIEPTGAVVAISANTRRSLYFAACKIVTASASAVMVYVNSLSTVTLQGCWITGTCVYGWGLTNYSSTNLQYSLIDITSNNAGYAALRADTASGIIFHSSLLRCRVSGYYCDITALSYARFTTCSPFVWLSGTKTGVTLRSGGTTSALANNITAIYGFTTPLDIQSQTYGSTDYYPLVQRFPEATAPAVRTNEAQVWAANQNGEAGNEALHILSETDKLLKFGNRLAWSGGLQRMVTAKTANFTASIAEQNYTCNATTAIIAVTLPSPASCYDSAITAGTILQFLKTDSTRNPVTLIGTCAGEVPPLLVAGQSMTIQSDGTYWRVIAPPAPEWLTHDDGSLSANDELIYL